MEVWYSPGSYAFMRTLWNYGWGRRPSGRDGDKLCKWLRIGAFEFYWGTWPVQSVQE